MTTILSVSLITVVIPLLAVLLAPVVAYFGTVRKLSGKIATSEAESLWAESTAIRADYREENTRMRERIEVLEERTDYLATENRTLRSANVELEQRVGRLEADNERLRQVNTALRARVTALESRLIGLGQRVDGVEEHG